jgi:hypothetical protein
MADVQIAVIDQQNTQIALAAPSETEVTVAVPGVQGPVGEGVPQGGTANQVLFKQSGTDYDTAWSEITSEMIGDLEIVNADIAADAEIAVSKLADGSARQLLQTDAAGTGVEWTSNVDVPGTLDVTGAATFDSSVAVTGALIKSGSNVVTVGDTGTVTSTMLLDGTIVNADVNASAAIAGTKIAPNFGSQTVQTTGVVSHALGTALAPTVTFTGDTNTGLYSPGADQVAISTNGTGRLFVDASGRVGVGVASPVSGSKLHVNVDADGDFAIYGLSPSSNGLAGLIPDGTNGNALRWGGIGANAGVLRFLSGSATERMRLDSSGRLGLGTSSPAAGLHVSGTSGTPAIFERTGSNGSFIGLKDASGSFSYLGTNNGVFSVQTAGSGYSDKLVVTAAGNVGIGNTSPGKTLEVSTASSTDGIALSRAGSNRVLLTADGLIAWGATANQGTLTWDANQAIIRAAASNSLVFAANNSAEHARIDTSGRLLVGTSSSATGLESQYAKLQVIGNSSGAGGGAYITFGKDEAATSITADEMIARITFGNTGPAEFAYISCQADGTAGSNDYPGRLVFSTTADGASSPTERMRITNGGLIDIGGLYSVGADAIRFDVQGSNFSRNTTSSATHIFFVNPNGGVGSITTSGSATAYNTSSDYRLKENVVPLTGAIDRLNDLQVHRFSFIADPDKTVDGFIAHEAQAVVPECVTGEKDAVDDEGNPIYQGIDQSKLVPLLTAALQEALVEIESLKDRVTALEA